MRMSALSVPVLLRAILMSNLYPQAPHLPVHLGSMSFAVRYQIAYLKGDLKEGDVILSNHPVAGGSHLPDITCGLYFLSFEVWISLILINLVLGSPWV